MEVLSFLAKTKDGSDYIPAMCVEHDLNGAALKALLAINKRTYTDGDSLLQSLKTGFENISKYFEGHYMVRLSLPFDVVSDSSLARAR